MVDGGLTFPEADDPEQGEENTIVGVSEGRRVEGKRVSYFLQVYIHLVLESVAGRTYLSDTKAGSVIAFESAVLPLFEDGLLQAVYTVCGLDGKNCTGALYDAEEFDMSVAVC
jgi:hypothetical protein